VQDCKKPKKKAAASVEFAAAKPSKPNWVVPTQISTSSLEVNSDLDNLPIEACVELISRLPMSIPSLLIGADRPRALMMTVILFVAEYGSTP
jgi:hypothetical protein